MAFVGVNWSSISWKLRDTVLRLQRSEMIIHPGSLTEDVQGRLMECKATRYPVLLFVIFNVYGDGLLGSRALLVLVLLLLPICNEVSLSARRWD